MKTGEAGPTMGLMNRSFETTTTGKWILLGEHAVLRGSPALVFPLESLKLSFKFIPGQPAEDLSLELSGDFGAELDLLFWGVLEKSCLMTGIRRGDISGVVHIRSDIPVGAGLGASAAFCVAFARWFSSEGFIPGDDIESFARELENLFHGESSGLDIAVANSAKALRFHRDQGSKILDLKWKPQFFLSYSGQRGVTRECVAKVKSLWQSNRSQAVELDRQMESAVVDAEQALSSEASLGAIKLASALKAGSSCFSAWGLFDGASEKKATNLLQQGATAVKPTGSGGGGYLLSYWEKDPPAELLKSGELIPCFAPESVTEISN